MLSDSPGSRPEDTSDAGALSRRALTAAESGIIGESAAIRRVRQEIALAAEAESPVLITGETGTGKELVARALHYSGSRRNGPFVPVNCSAIPENLLESELFGVERGVVTGVIAREGKFEQARGGTIFLDEIGDMSPALQAKVLRVLQDRTFERVGGRKLITVNFRVVAATNKNLVGEIQAGRFRSDLYYRLNVLPIYVPPLRERTEDIPLLVAHFLTKHRASVQGRITGVEEEAMKLFREFPWPGNVRELENAVLYAMAHEPGSVIRVASLRPELTGQAGPDAGAVESGRLPTDKELKVNYTFERWVKCGRSLRRTADSLDISEKTVRDRIRRYRSLVAHS